MYDEEGISDSEKKLDLGSIVESKEQSSDDEEYEIANASSTPNDTTFQGMRCSMKVV